MSYIKKLIIRLILTIIILIIPINIFYILLLKPTLYLSSIPFNTIITQDSLIINSIRFIFIPACIATAAYYLFTILTLLTNINLKKTIKLLVSGFLLIFIANIIRIIILIQLYITKNIQLFNTLHFFFWNIVSTIYIVIIWIILTKTLKIKEIPVYSYIKHILKNIRKFK